MKIKEPVLIAIRKEIDHLGKLEAREADLVLISLGGDIMKHVKKEERFRLDRKYLTEFLELISDKAVAGDEI